MEIQPSGGEISGTLVKLKDDMSSKANHATLVAAKENEVEIQTGVAPSGIWLRGDLEKVNAPIFRYVGIGTRLALCCVGWLDHAGVRRFGAQSDLLRAVVGAARPRRAL